MTLDSFFDNFVLLTDAPNAVNELRAIIRQIAIRGKLLAQNFEDEPASKLIQETQVKKRQLVKEKKLREASYLPEVELHEISYEIPEGWEWVRFGNITICRDGERIPLSREQRATRHGEFDYYGASGVIDKIDGFLFDKPLLLIGEDGANLINRSTPIAFIAGGKYWVNNHAHVLDAVSFDCLKYLELYFNAIDLKPFVTGTAQPKMNQAKMNSIPISLPPLAEQKRIVEKCDRLLILCDEIEKRQQQRQASLLKMNEGAISQLLTAQNSDDFHHHWQGICNNFDLLYSIPETIPKLRQAILQLAVQGKLVPQNPNDESVSVLLENIEEEKAKLIKENKIRALKPLPSIKQDETPFALPENWLWVRMQEIFTVITDGDHQAPPQSTSGVPFLVISNVREGCLNFESTRFVSKEFFLSVDNNRKPVEGDILYTVVGSYGIPIVVNTNQPFFVQRHIALLKPSKLLEVNYLKYVLKSDLVFEQATRFATGIAQKTVPLNGLRKMVVPLPPLAEQKRIVAKVDTLLSLCDALEAKLKAARDSSTTLMEIAAKQILVA